MNASPWSPTKIRRASASSTRLRRKSFGRRRNRLRELYDGRYATLHDLLTDPQSQMGHTSHLGATDLAALEEYLRSL